MQLQPIAHVVSPYREKFGVPRQPGLVPAARGYLEMLPDFASPSAFEGLQGFSHIWVIFGFHVCEGRFRLRVRPPRLGGNREQGVFATRSPFRPNNLGLSVLRFEGLEQNEAGLRVTVSGLDLVDGTPVYDIKPYIPYTDRIPDALGGFAQARPQACLEVVFSSLAAQQLDALGDRSPGLRDLIVQSLALDPRPAYHQGREARIYGILLADNDVRWQVKDGRAEVIEILPAPLSD